MSCENEGHVGAEDSGNQPKYRCLYCGAWGYSPTWFDACCEDADLTHSEETGERIYPELCECICHVDEEEEMPD
jgi:hypothetical protein